MRNLFATGRCGDTETYQVGKKDLTTGGYRTRDGSESSLQWRRHCKRTMETSLPWSKRRYERSLETSLEIRT